MIYLVRVLLKHTVRNATMCIVLDLIGFVRVNTLELKLELNLELN